MFSFTKPGGFNASSFQVIKDAMLQSDELPLAEFIDDDQWQAVGRNGIAVENASSAPTRGYARCRLLPMHVLDRRGLQIQRRQHRDEES